MSSVLSSYVTGGLARAGGGAAHAGAMPGVGGKFLKGGRWDRYLGKPVEVAEAGRQETFVGDDGTGQKRAGPQTVVPHKTGIVVPAPPPRIQVPAPVTTRPRVVPLMQTASATGNTMDESAAPPTLSVPPPPVHSSAQLELDNPADQAALTVDPQPPAQPIGVAPHMGRGRAFLLAQLINDVLLGVAARARLR